MKKEIWLGLPDCSSTHWSLIPAGCWGPAKWVSVYKWIWVSAERLTWEREPGPEGINSRAGMQQDCASPAQQPVCSKGWPGGFLVLLVCPLGSAAIPGAGLVSPGLTFCGG